MASGVKVNDECKTVYQEVKMKKAGQMKRRYVILRLNEQLTEVVVDQDCTQTCDRPFLEVVGDLPQDDGRYLVYDYEYSSSVGQASKVIMVMWWVCFLFYFVLMLAQVCTETIKAECVDERAPDQFRHRYLKSVVLTSNFRRVSDRPFIFKFGVGWTDTFAPPESE